MRLLVLGGTSFVGRALVAHALERGDEVTVFSRGVTNPDLFPDATHARGDRATGDYASLGGGTWDAVVDVSAYVPRHVQQATTALRERVGRYLLVSTGSVYDLPKAPEVITEDAPRLSPERGTETVTNETYGALKVACEDDALSLWGPAATIVRPGIVAGPHDPTDRFTWWVRRVARGGRMAFAARPDQPVQVVDSRDLAHLMRTLCEADRAGIFNAVGPAEPTTLAALVQACEAASGSTVERVQIDPADVDPPLPLVLADPADDVAFRRDAQPARSHGLTATTLVDTARDVLAWDAERGHPRLSTGLTEDAEDALLAQG